MPTLYALGLARLRLSGLCVLCGMYARRAEHDYDFLCSACHDEMNWLPEPMQLELAHDRALIIQHASTYTGVMRRAIGEFKDRENLTTLPFLLTALSQLAQILPDEGVLLPMPTTHARLIDRGFFPVALLARYLSDISGLPIYQGVLRIAERLHQRSLSRLDRLHNLDGVFAIDYDPDFDTIIIVDDVSTTGSTIKAVAETLYTCYGDQVRVAAVCLAHGS